MGDVLRARLLCHREVAVLKSTFPIYDTHPELADALRCVSRGWKITLGWSQELRMNGLIYADFRLTPIARMILKEDPLALDG